MRRRQVRLQRRLRPQAAARAPTAAAAARALPTGPPSRSLGQVAENLCVGHSDHWVEVLYQVHDDRRALRRRDGLRHADGRYYSAMRNAVAYLSHKPAPIVVRALFASFPIQGAIDTTAVAKDFGSRMRPGSALKLHIGGYRSSNIPPSWNHSKIVAVDGRVAMSGGHDMWAKQYSASTP